jgi:hypothetical protein
MDQTLHTSQVDEDTKARDIGHYSGDAITGVETGQEFDPCSWPSKRGTFREY